MTGRCARTAGARAATKQLRCDGLERWREHERSARREKAPVQPDVAASERKARESEAAEHALSAAGRVAAQIRESATHLSSVLSQTANVLEGTAALADAHAERMERAGRADAGAAERRAADRARQGAQRARLHAKEWLEFSLGRPR